MTASEQRQSAAHPARARRRSAREGESWARGNRTRRWLLVAKTGRLRPMPMYHVHVAKEGKTFDPKAVELPDTKSVNATPNGSLKD